MAVADPCRVEQLPQLPTDGAAHWWGGDDRDDASAHRCRRLRALNRSADRRARGAARRAGDAQSSKAAANGPVKNLADTLRKQMQNGLQGVAGTLNSLPKPGEPGSFIPKQTKTNFRET